MAYTGAWKRAQRSSTPGEVNPNLGDQVDDMHLHPQEVDDPFPEPTPNLPSLPEYMYAADDFMLPPNIYVHDPMITEPLDHDSGGIDRAESYGVMLGTDPDSYAAHMQDHGAAAVHHQADGPVERDDRDTYRTVRVEMDRPSGNTSRAALTRGRNALPENNPDGAPDQGHFTMRWIDRQFVRRQARHDMAPIRPYVAGNAVELQGAQGPDANAYTSPWANLANARTLKLATPQLRRVPRQPDDNATTDGTQDPQYAQPAYWDGW